MEGKIKSKHIVIVGGMGPQASVYAHSLLIKMATIRGAVNNEDYPRVTHLSVNVKDFISSPEYRQEACDYLVRCLREINLADVDEAFIACNTAHILKDEMEAATGLHFTSLIDTTVQALLAGQAVTKVGVVSTPSTLKMGLYTDQLQDKAEVIVPSDESQSRIEKIIREVIGGGDEEVLSRQLRLEIDELTNKGAEKVVLGCTELSLLGTYLDPSVVVDPLQLTIERVLE